MVPQTPRWTDTQRVYTLPRRVREFTHSLIFNFSTVHICVFLNRMVFGGPESSDPTLTIHGHEGKLVLGNKACFLDLKPTDQRGSLVRYNCVVETTRCWLGYWVA